MDSEGNVDFADTSVTQNTRVSYPIYHIDNIQQPSIGKNPKNIFYFPFLFILPLQSPDYK